MKTHHQKNHFRREVSLPAQISHESKKERAGENQENQKKIHSLSPLCSLHSHRTWGSLDLQPQPRSSLSFKSLSLLFYLSTLLASPLIYASAPLSNAQPPPPPPAPSAGAAPTGGAQGAAASGYTNSTVINPTSRDACSYSFTIDKTKQCATTEAAISSASNYSMMSMMMGGMGTTLAGTGAQAAASSSKDQAQTLRITGSMQIASGAMTLGIAAGNLYHAVNLGREKTRLNANAAEFTTASTGTVTANQGGDMATPVTGALTASQAGYVTGTTPTQNNIITNFNLNSNVTMVGATDLGTQAVRLQQVSQHQGVVDGQVKTIATEAASEQKMEAQKAGAAQFMPIMMGVTQMLTAGASMAGGALLLKQADDLKSADPTKLNVVAPDIGNSSNAPASTGGQRSPSAVTGNASDQGESAQAQDENSDLAPPNGGGSPFAPSPTGTDLAGTPPPPSDNASGGDNGGAGGGGGDGGLSASTSPASAGDDEGSKDPKLADVSTDQTSYAAAGGGYGGGGGGSGDAGNVDLNSLLGQILPKQDEDKPESSEGILSFGKAGTLEPYSPLGSEVNIFTKISEKYSALNRAGAI